MLLPFIFFFVVEPVLFVSLPFGSLLLILLCKGTASTRSPDLLFVKSRFFVGLIGSVGGANSFDILRDTLLDDALFLRNGILSNFGGNRESDFETSGPPIKGSCREEGVSFLE